MLNFCSLYSGSTGNSLFLESENTKVLIDAGESAKKIEKALSSIDVDIHDIDAILITHEHQDHVHSISTLSKKYDLPIYATEKTWDAMPSKRDSITSENLNYFKSNEKFEIGDLEVYPFSIPHDAADPCGFNIINKDVKLSIATDLGHMTKNILEKIENSKFIMLEANYDPEILKCSHYPYVLKERIAGPNRAFV